MWCYNPCMSLAVFCSSQRRYIWNISNMAVITHWLQLVYWVMVTFLLSKTQSKLDESFLRKQPCDVHENVTKQTVTFYCSGRGLTQVPEGIFQNTTTLDLSENKIKNLTNKALKDLHLLTYLNLNWMNKNNKVNVSPEAFANLTNLNTLLLNGAGLSSIPKQLPKTLTELRLVENKIISLNATSFSHIKSLKQLYLSKNCYYWNSCFQLFSIKPGTFSNLTMLEHLTLSFNNLSRVPTGLPGSLITLELASNHIRCIGSDDFKGLSNLTILKIQGNCPRCQNAPYPCIPCPNGSIEIHKQAFDHLSNLKLLHLAGNSIRWIKKSWFRNFVKLKELYLSFNFLMNAITTGDFLSNLPHLKKLDLSFNFNMKYYPETVILAPTFANLTSLETLHLQGLVFKEIRNNSLTPLYGLQNLSVLDMGINFLVCANLSIFGHFQNLKLLYLSENRLYPIGRSVDRKLGSNASPSFNVPALSAYNSKTDLSLQVGYKLVKPECYAAGRVLDLSRNNLFFISFETFEGYENISCLNLSRNGFASAPNGVEFTSLPRLKYLDLSYNKIDLAYDNAFKELAELEVLDLSFNPHYFTVLGVTHNMDFLKNLPKLRVLNLSSNSIFTLTTKKMYSDSLKELQFQYNNLGKMWRTKDKTYNNLFFNLTNLTHLDISYNNIGNIPNEVYKYLPATLKTFRLMGNSLSNFTWSEMGRFTQLEELVLSHNRLSHISKNVNDSMPFLHYLDISHNHVSELDCNFLIGAVNLKQLDLSYNKIAVINQSTFPSSQDNHLSSLWLHGNPFRCTCDILEFILWIDTSDVKIPKLATSVTCHAPESIKGKGVIFFDNKECNDEQVAFPAYFCSTSFICCFTLMTTVMHMFYWDMSYLIYYLKAKLKGYQYLSSEKNVYDAFITYDTKDPSVSDWVLNQLRVELEDQGERYLPVCLEERDWVPGCPILDSMTQSIQQSRKTVFVLTRSYINSGAFKMAVYLAHQRLLDENEDVIVLLLLEPVLQHSHFLRLRQRLCSRSVLEWPASPTAEPWFWQCLRNAIRVENGAMYSKIYSRYFTSRNKRGEE